MICLWGALPDRSVAQSIRDEVLAFEEAQRSGDISLDVLPDAIKKLQPLQASVSDHGVLLIFRIEFVEAYGYFYSKEGLLPPDEISPYCKLIGDGVYDYYNPG